MLSPVTDKLLGTGTGAESCLCSNKKLVSTTLAKILTEEGGLHRTMMPSPQNYPRKPSQSKGHLGTPPRQAEDSFARSGEKGLPDFGRKHEVDGEGGEVGRARSAPQAASRDDRKLAQERPGDRAEGRQAGVSGWLKGGWGT